MGNICSGRIQVNDIPTSPKAHHPLNSKNDLQFNAGLFIQENHESFYSVYTLHNEPLGSGAFAEVWLCDHKRTLETRAVKILHKSGITEEDIRSRAVFTEVEILKSLDHPNVLKVFEYFEDEIDYYIVMEFCPGGDVFNKLETAGSVTERYAARLIKFLLSGLAYLHSRHVVHRDIKPENLLITNGDSYEEFSIKIIDFNVATTKKSASLQEVAGTTDYMAPEVFRGLYNEKCDVWSTGVVLYSLISGSLPFPCPNEQEAERNICHAKFTFPKELFGKVSEACKDFIAKLLNKNPNSRPSALEALEHPWLKISSDKCDKATMRNTLKRMKSLTSSGKLKELFTTFIISQLSSNSSTRKLEKVFSAIDINKDGVISLQELITQLSLEMTSLEAEKQAKQIMSKIDADGSGQMEYTEFLRTAIDEESLLSRENIRKAFYYFDKDNSESIEKQELVQWLSSGEIIPESVIQELMEEADMNNDGTIDINEFEDLLASKLKIE